MKQLTKENILKIPVFLFINLNFSKKAIIYWQV